MGEFFNAPLNDASVSLPRHAMQEFQEQIKSCSTYCGLLLIVKAGYRGNNGKILSKWLIWLVCIFYVHVCREPVPCLLSALVKLFCW